MIENILHTLHIEDIESSEHPSDFITDEKYNILILRLPEFKNSNITTVSYAFLVHNDICYIYNRETKGFDKLGSLSKMSTFLDDKIDELIKRVKNYHYSAEQLEEELYDETFDDSFMHKWLNCKKSTSLIYRLMFHAIVSFELFLSYHKRQKSLNFEELAYNDLLEHMKRIRELSHEIMDSLDNLYNFYRAKVDEKMNKNVYYLTILSGLFLPLTLITGFFGMNTGGLPWADDTSGTIKAVILSIILELILFLPFYFLNKRKK